jgi:hypothetical protein
MSKGKRGSSLNRYNRVKFKLDSDCLLKFRSLEGSCTVPSPVVSEMLTALFNRNFSMNMDEKSVKNYTVQLLSMLGIISLFNNDRRVCIDRVFELHSYPHKIKEDDEFSRYVFSLRTSLKPEHLVSYLYQLLFDNEDINLEEINKTDDYINNVFILYLENLIKNSDQRLNELG